MRDWLIALRAGRSQSKVAKESGIAQSTYASIETGYRTPSVETAKKIADVLGFPWTQFFENVDDPDNKTPPAGPGAVDEQDWG